MVPDINAEYVKYGSNNEGLIVLAAHSSGDDAAIQSWDNTNGVEFPSISGSNGGSSIFSTYQVGATPTLILIAPDQEIVEQDIWPISELVPTLEKYNFTGIKQNTAFNLSEFLIGTISSRKICLSVPVSGKYELSIYSVNGKILKKVLNGYLAEGTHEISWNSNEFADGVFLAQTCYGDFKKTKKFTLY